MNLFTVNQVNQVYVASGVTNNLPSNAGQIKIVKTPDGKGYFQHYSKAGELTRTDIIENILWAKATPASEMATALKKATITLATGAYDSVSNEVVPGQDYILRLEFNNYIGISIEDSTYLKYGVVHTVAGMTVSDFYKAMAISIVKNMARESVKLVKVELKTSNSTVEVTSTTSADSLSGNYTGIVLTETEPDWILGLKQQKVVTLKAIPTEISVLNSNGTYDDITWGNVAYADSSTVIKNGKLAADYEYFFHGERGDQYRMVGWPDYIPTAYDVDPTKEYDFIQIHFAYIGPNEGCQKSEKDVTFLAPRSSDDTDGELGKAASTIAEAIDTEFGTSLVPASESEGGEG